MVTFDIVKAGILGKDIDYSLSPVLFRMLGQAMSAPVYYEIINTSIEDIDSLKTRLNELADKGYAGINVTIPYKSMAFELCDHFFQKTKFLGAVNTLLFREGRTIGLNTDFIALRESLKILNITEYCSVLLKGAGGAAKAYAFALAEIPYVKLFITNRNMKKAVLLQQRLKMHGMHSELINEEEISNHSFSGLVNATPVGRSMDEIPFSKSLVSNCEFVIDAVYKNGNTALFNQSLELNKKIISGIELLFKQGVASFEAMTDSKVENTGLLYNEFLERIQD